MLFDGVAANQHALGRDTVVIAPDEVFGDDRVERVHVVPEQGAGEGLEQRVAFGNGGSHADGLAVIAARVSHRVRAQRGPMTGSSVTRWPALANLSSGWTSAS